MPSYRACFASFSCSSWIFWTLFSSSDASSPSWHGNMKQLAEVDSTRFNSSLIHSNWWLLKKGQKFIWQKLINRKTSVLKLLHVACDLGSKSGNSCKLPAVTPCSYKWCKCAAVQYLWIFVNLCNKTFFSLKIPTPIEGEGGGDKTNLSNSTFFCLETLG